MLTTNLNGFLKKVKLQKSLDKISDINKLVRYAFQKQ